MPAIPQPLANRSGPWKLVSCSSFPPEHLRLLTLLFKDLCQPASSKLLIFLVVTLNIVTDIYLMAIPIPVLWKAKVPKFKKLMLVLLFSGGVFVMVAGILRCVLILKVRPRFLTMNHAVLTKSTDAKSESYYRSATSGILGSA